MITNTPINPHEARRLIVETAAECGESAHLGGALSMIELLSVLFGGFLRHRPDQPDWEDRDIFILSKGHAVLGYLVVLHLFGYFDRDKLRTFQTNDSDLIAHPIKKIPLGIESSNGSLGQGLSYGLGVAIGMQKRGQDRRVAVMMGDGECNEGSVWESAALASELGITNLVAMVDVNGFRNDGENTMYTRGPNIADVWRGFGWHVAEVDGHDEAAITASMDSAFKGDQGPHVIVAHTTKGKGISFMEANNDWHHNRITAKVLEEIEAEMGGANHD
ncbi:MAG: transketolase [Pseudomonadota bacterium]